ncbi:hypothetical protein FQA39_LY01483 [Lamprigera yunnana]|nr:hypothetical protein FQA39_LY01483 [Lamprigera yunnana]
MIESTSHIKFWEQTNLHLGKATVESDYQLLAKTDKEKRNKYKVDEKYKEISRGHTKITQWEKEKDNWQQTMLIKAMDSEENEKSVIRIRDGATGCADARCNARFNKNNVLLNIYECEKFMALESHILNQFFYDSAEIQKVLDQSSGDDLSIQNMDKTEDITEDVKILHHWEYSEGLSSPMMPIMSETASDPMRNGNNFMKTITLQRDYRTCTFNRYDAEAIFQLKPIINYRLKLMQSSWLKGFYDNIVEFVIIQKSKREEIRRMAGINIDDFSVYDDGGAYEIFEQTLNSKYNLNSYNVLCVMEMHRHRPGYILNDIIANR